MQKKVILSIGLAMAIFTGCGSSDNDKGNGGNNNEPGNYIPELPKTITAILGEKTWGEYIEGADVPKNCYTFGSPASSRQITAYFEGDNTKSVVLDFTYIQGDDNTTTMKYKLGNQVVSSTDILSNTTDTQINVHKVWEDNEADALWKITPNCTEIMENY